jgi:tetratricopeptide (TPR) repeat protein
MGRVDVALRLVAEALADAPDAEEVLELRIVESGARLDLGEDAAARLVLESALGGRPDPADLNAGDSARVRVAAAYAELLQAQGEDERAEAWFTVIAAADPDNETGAVERLGIEFVDLEDELDAEEDDDRAVWSQDHAEVETEVVRADEVAAPEFVAALPEDVHGLGSSFDDEVEAEVAELLGEVDPPASRGADDEPADDGEH